MLLLNIFSVQNFHKGVHTQLHDRPIIHEIYIKWFKQFISGQSFCYQTHKFTRIDAYACAVHLHNVKHEERFSSLLLLMFRQVFKLLQCWFKDLILIISFQSACATKYSRAWTFNNWSFFPFFAQPGNTPWTNHPTSLLLFKSHKSVLFLARVLTLSLSLSLNPSFQHQYFFNSL